MLFRLSYSWFHGGALVVVVFFLFQLLLITTVGGLPPTIILALIIHFHLTCVIQVGFHDYYIAPRTKTGGSEIISRNAASCAAVLLASQQEHIYETFGFAVLVVQLFHLPSSKPHHPVQPARVSGLIAIGGLMSLSVGVHVLLLYELAVIMICVVAPAGFEYMKRIKNAHAGKEVHTIIQRHLSLP